jgi:hypothetical protein
MIDAFDSNIPALNFKCETNGKMLMSQAFNDGLVPEMLNTFDCIRMIKPEFKRENFEVYYFSHIVGLNMNDAIEDVDDDIKNKAIDEYKIIQQINELTRRNPKVNLIELVKHSIIFNCVHLLTHLIKNKYIKLLYNILIRDNYSIMCSLLEIDPRQYNYEAYHLCLETKNDIGIELIKKNIIERNWLETQVFINSINNAYGQESSLPNNILSHYKTILV